MDGVTFRLAHGRVPRPPGQPDRLRQGPAPGRRPGGATFSRFTPRARNVLAAGFAALRAGRRKAAGPELGVQDLLILA